ncbi:MAG: ankyrin repeat domain-containing protein [Chthoniobacteraceae bacterium]
MKTIALLMAVALLAFTAAAAEEGTGTKPDLRHLLQQGLFEEEANRNNGKAAAAYAELVSQYEAQRSYAATALFRLAEIRRKEGKKEEAIALHQRLLTEFPMQEALAKASKERLAELGGEVPAGAAPLDAPTDAEAKELVRLREIVRNSPDLLNSGTGDESLTPLMRAAKNGWLTAASFALDSGASIEGPGNPLQLAAGEGHKRMVELLLKRGANVDSAYRGETALHAAARRKRVEVARVLLANGADPNGGNQKGDNTPLLLAISDTYDELTRLLLEKGADPARLGKDGIFPLMTAVVYRNKEVIAALLKARADVNASNGQTALHVAAERWPEIVPFLLENGASATAVATSRIGFTSPEVTPRTGFTPLHHTMLAFRDDQSLIRRPGNDRLDSPLTLDKLEVLKASWKALIDKGADVNAPDSQGISPFAMAAARPDLPIDALAFLVEKGASLEADLAEGKSALYYAQGVSPERRLELETRFRFPEWSKDRGIRILNLCPSGSTLQPLLINESGSSTVLPTAREALLMLAERLAGAMPNKFNLRIYRANESKEIVKIAEIPFEAGTPLPKTPALVWGDVLVVVCDEQTSNRRRVTAPRPIQPETALLWLRSSSSEDSKKPSDPASEQREQDPDRASQNEADAVLP